MSVPHCRPFLSHSVLALPPRCCLSLSGVTASAAVRHQFRLQNTVRLHPPGIPLPYHFMDKPGLKGHRIGGRFLFPQPKSRSCND